MKLLSLFTDRVALNGTYIYHRKVRMLMMMKVKAKMKKERKEKRT